MQEHIKKAAQAAFAEGAQPAVRGAGVERNGNTNGSDPDVEPKSRKYRQRKQLLLDLETTGPDAKGFDVNIKSAQDLKKAIVTICRSWTSIREIYWTSQGLPVLSEVIAHVARLGTLETLEISGNACEEDFFYETDPPAGALHPARKHRCSSSKEKSVLISKS